MSGMRRNVKLALGGFLCLWVLLGAASAQDCDKTSCLGPLRFYEDINCKPVYTKPDDCCPSSYDCSHLNDRKDDKCYANGQEYNMGERLKDEDRAHPCDICFCGKMGNKTNFICAIVDCFHPNPKLGCYMQRELNTCCGQKEICSNEERAKCVVDGKTYYDGDIFYPANDSKLMCQCTKDYEGKNVPPFCRRVSCGTEQRHFTEIREFCAPIYEPNWSMVQSCYSFFRCQKSEDKVIQSEKQNPSPQEDQVCKFGNLKLQIGDEVSESSDPREKCLECKCELPPFVSCHRLQDEECKKKYPKGD